MNNELLDDYEQGELVKKWLAENGPAIALGVVLGLGGLFGYRFWQDQSAQQRAEAAAAYSDLVNGLDGELQATTTELQQFASEHDSPAYEGLAALQLAHRAVEDKNLDEAAKLFRIAAEKAEPAEMRHVAGLRLARIQLQMGDLDEALVTVDRFEAQPFESMADQIRGDIYIAQGNRDAARLAYQEALDNMPSGGGDRNLLQMKLDDLAVASPAPAEAADIQEPAGMPAASADPSVNVDEPAAQSTSDDGDEPETETDESVEDASTAESAEQSGDGDS